MGVSILAGGTVLPSPDEMKISDEIIWSANTGRTASGLMVGDAVAEKRTLAVTWGVLTKAQIDLVRGRLVSGFFPVTVTVDGESVTISAYRGTLSYELMGTYGGVTYYRSAAVSIIQQ